MNAPVAVTAPFAGRVAVVTGGSSGIGAQTVRLLGERGATTVVLDLQADPAQPDEFVCDVGSPTSVAVALEAVRERFGQVDVLVHAAAVALHKCIPDTSVEEWSDVLRVNLTGAFTVIRAVLPGMQERGWGRIVTVSSGTAVRVGGGNSAYAASKAGLIALTKVTALEGAPHGVTANVVAPGLTDTPMTRAVIGGDEELLAAARTSGIANPMGVVLRPAEVAEGIVFFCLPEAGRVTGQVLHVSAGSVMP